MSRRISRTARGAFAALVAAGLTFGAASAFAAPDAGPRCPYNPDIGQIAQACTTNSTCVSACTAWWGSYNPGHCVNGCCTCNI